MRFTSIRSRIAVALILVTVIPLLFITSVAYVRFTDLINVKTQETVGSVLSSSAGTIEAVLSEIDRITETFIYQQYSVSSLSGDPDTETLADSLINLVSKEPSQYELLMCRRSMSFICDNLLYNKNYINGLYLFTPNGHTISFGRNGTDIRVGYRPNDEDWYRQTIELEGRLFIDQVRQRDYIINSRPSILFARALYDTQRRTFLGVLMLDCQLSIFRELDNDVIEDSLDILLVNQNNSILYSTNNDGMIGSTLDPTLAGRIADGSSGSFESDGGEVLTVYTSFPRRDWKLLESVSIASLNRQFRLTRNLLVVMAAICMLLFVAAAFGLAQQISRPIESLSRIMKQNKNRDLVYASRYLNLKDEIGVLFREYNAMLEEINRFIRESYENKIIVLDAQMKALESQINSHFLYNTLESINSIAEVEDVPRISIMAKALGDMFRYAIKTRSELVLVKEELTHVRNYIAIQSIRYADKVRFILEVPAEFEDCRILKLIIQPIVENAIYHGLEGKHGQGYICIRGVRKDDRLVFTVIDNGIGMSEYQLGEINKMLQEPPEFGELGHRSSASIGLKNVHSRIRLYYGLEYGLAITSLRRQGTTVTITVPCREDTP